MKRPNLVNQDKIWTPFKSVPIPERAIIRPVQPIVPSVSQPVAPSIRYIEVQELRQQIIKKNSVVLNIFAMLVILAISYFLYSIYLERKLFSEYIDYVKSNEQYSF